MKLICGLGNPGKEYDNTRHNVGFMAIDNFCQTEKFNQKFNGLYLEKTVGGEKVIFLKPQSYMNLSGLVVKPFVDYFKIDDRNVLIIRDDLDLPLGKLRIKFDSSSGGDNGIKSIIGALGHQRFFQLKIGISKNTQGETKDYVLGKFSKSEEETLKNAIALSEKIIEEFISGDLNTNKDFICGE